MTKKTNSKNKVGKPLIKINLQELEDLCAMQCTDVEIAAFFKCTKGTLVNRKRNPEFREAYERGKDRGKVSLRRLMWSKAQGREGEFLKDEKGHTHFDEKGKPFYMITPITPDTTMQIWLSKNLLGYADKIEQTGKDGEPLQSFVFVMPDGSRCTAKELANACTIKT